MVNTIGQLEAAFARDLQRLQKADSYGNQKPWKDLERICPCCGNGYPVCAEFETISRPMAHRLTCITYRFDNKVCDGCEKHLEEQP